jgi:hypothetical protein
LPEGSPFLDLTRDHAAVERGHDLVLRWFAVGTVRDVRLFPAFLRTALEEIHDSPEHVVRVDPDG